MNPTIGRSDFNSRTTIGMRTKKFKSGKASIKDNFEPEESSDEEQHITPGPGNYLRPFHTNLVGQFPINHRHP